MLRFNKSNVYRCCLVAVLACLFAQTSVAKSKLYFVHNDHRGAPVMLTDKSGTKVWEAKYDPFGAAVVNEDPDGDGRAVELNVRLPGQYYDKESGTTYNYYRDYDPSLGRYIQSDPIGLNGGLNTYGYVGGNPISYADPYGLDGLSALKKAWDFLNDLDSVNDAKNFYSNLDDYQNDNGAFCASPLGESKLRNKSAAKAFAALPNAIVPFPFAEPFGSKGIESTLNIISENKRNLEDSLCRANSEWCK